MALALGELAEAVMNFAELALPGGPPEVGLLGPGPCQGLGKEGEGFLVGAAADRLLAGLLEVVDGLGSDFGLAPVISEGGKLRVGASRASRRPLPPVLQASHRRSQVMKLFEVNER